MLGLILMIAALVFFILAAVGASVPRLNLVACGLACLTGAMLAGRY